MQTILQYTVAGAATASIYSLISVGITMIYGVARVMNVAHAMMFLLGAFLTAELVGRGWLYGPAAIVSIIVVTAIGAVLYTVLFARLLDRPFGSLIVSLGLVVVADAILHRIWGVDVYRINGALSTSHRVNGVSFTTGGVVTIGVTLVLVAALTAVFRLTAAGRTLRAVAENPGTSTILGVRAGRVTASVFVGGTAMAALAGALVGTFIPFSTASAGTFVLKAFAIAIVGGLGSPLGALVASALFAAVEIVPIAAGHAQWSPSMLFLALVAVLLVRPHGLFGRRGSATAHDDVLPDEVTPRRAHSGVRAQIGVLVTLGLLAAAPLLTTSNSTEGLLAYAVGLLVVAYAVWVPLRFLGVPSLGHAAIFGVGAYTGIIAMKDWELGLGYQLLLASCAGGIVALAMAAIAMRAKGLASVAIITLALGGLLVSLIANLVSITGGVSGVTATAPLQIGPTTFSLTDSDVALYYLGLVFVAITVTALLWFARSGRGKSLIAVRDSQLLSESLGYNSYLVKVVVYAVSGAAAGLAGVLYLYYSRYLEPVKFGDTLEINLLLAVLLGGATSLYGPMFGVCLFVFLPEVLPFSSSTNQMVYGLLLVAIASSSPGGIASWPRRLRALTSIRPRGHAHRPVKAASHA